MAEGGLGSNILPWLIQVSVIILQLQQVYPFNVHIPSALKYTGQKDSYFGFSTELLINTTGKWLLVGSPFAQPSLEPVVNRSGAIYKCEVNNRTVCEQVALDRTGNSRSNSRPTYVDLKENQMLGFNMALSDDKNPKLAACAPLWKNRGRQFISKQQYGVQGLCYEMNSYNIIERRPLLDDYKQIVNQKYLYIYAQAGFSLTYSKGKSNVKAKLVLGVPGLRNWMGGIAAIKAGIPNDKPDVKDLGAHNSYTGYSITSGNIYGPAKVSYIIGSPNSKPDGEIIVLDNRKYEVVARRAGLQFESLFGASVCTVDFDGDGLDDVVVGAPLYSTTKNREVGRVYVFTNQAQDKDGLSALPVPLRGTDLRMSRFGQAVTNVGDLNQDSFEDLAVGAPFEDDFHGSIYIFNGGLNGVLTEPSQIIKGKLVDEGLRAFGWSISKGRDMDNNSYPDFSVGAFLSDNVVLFRTQPIVTVIASLEVIPPQIKPAPSNIDIRLCMTFQGKHLPPNLLVDYNLTADISRQSFNKFIRAKFVSNGVPKISDTLTLTNNKTNCQNVSVKIQPDRDLLRPIIFELQFGLTEDSSVTPPPLLNVQQNTKLTATATFQNDCGDDEICVTDLKVDMKQTPESSALVLAKTAGLALHLTVNNSGEAAYEATLQIELPPRVKYVGVQSANVVLCTELLPLGTSSTRSISCDLGNPLDAAKLMDFEIKLNVNDVPRDTKALHFHSKVSSTSIEHNSTILDNQKSLTVYTKLDVEIILKSESTPEQIVYDRDGHDTLSVINATQTLTVMNVGPSVLPGGKVIIQLPHSDLTGEYTYLDYANLRFYIWNTKSIEWQEKNCLFDIDLVLPSGQLIEGELDTISDPTTTPEITSSTTTQENTSSTTTPENTSSTTTPENTSLATTPENASSYINHTTLPTIDSPTTFDPDSGGKTHRRKRDAEENRGKLDKEIINVLGCRSHRCIPVTCHFDQLLAGQEVKINIYLPFFQSVMAQNKTAASFVYQTSVTVQPESRIDLPSLLNDEAVTATIETVFLPSAPPQEQVTLWIYIVAGIFGFLLLVLIVFLLLKFGFFKRKKHSEVQDWKRKSGYTSSRRSRYMSHRASSSQGPVTPTPDGAG